MSIIDELRTELRERAEAHEEALAMAAEEAAGLHERLSKSRRVARKFGQAALSRAIERNEAIAERDAAREVLRAVQYEHWTRRCVSCGGSECLPDCALARALGDGE